MTAMLLAPNCLLGTTCIVGQKFKVHQVCGEVRDFAGAAIPNASVQLSRRGQPPSVLSIQSDDKGKFQFSSISDGEYELRVKFAGFWDAVQPFAVKQGKAEQRCLKPIRVVMKPAGQCSYVENAWKDTKSH